MASVDEVFDGRPFSLAQGRDAGISEGRLRGPRFERPFPGVRMVGPSASAASLEERMRQRCAEFAPRLRPQQWFSHESALALWRIPLPWYVAEAVHVSAHHPHSPPRVRGVVGHRLRERTDEDLRDSLSRVTTSRREPLVSAWAQVVDHWHGDDVIVAADAILTGHVGRICLEDLRQELLASRRVRHLRLLDEVRVGSESPRESRLRLLLCRAGLPTPDVNVSIVDARGDFIARLDLSYARWRVAVEYDGRQHAEDVTQFHRDAERWEAIRDAGWTLIRVLDQQLTRSPDAVVARVSTALWSAGWRPGVS